MMSLKFSRWRLSYQKKKPFDLAYDFWAFIEGATKEYEIDAEVPHKRILLPSEVHVLCKLLNEIFCMAVVHLLAMYIICLYKYQVSGSWTCRSIEQIFKLLSPSSK